MGRSGSHGCIYPKPVYRLTNRRQNTIRALAWVSTEHRQYACLRSTSLDAQEGTSVGKWDEKGIIARIVGYTEEFNTYKLYVGDTKKFAISCDITFLNDDGQNGNLSPTSDENDITILGGVTRQKVSKMTYTSSNGKQEQEHPEQSNEINRECCNESKSEHVVKILPKSHDRFEACQFRSKARSSSQQETIIKPGQSLLAKPPTLRETIKNINIEDESAQEYADASGGVAMMATIESDLDPKSYTEAMEREDAKDWEKAMNEELESLTRCKVWESVDRPKDINIVTNRWVLRIKRKPDGTVTSVEGE